MLPPPPVMRVNVSSSRSIHLVRGRDGVLEASGIHQALVRMRLHGGMPLSEADRGRVLPAWT
jgi:hypothetical protein